MLAIKRFLTSEAGPSKPDPSGTAIRLIRQLLEKHERLSTPQIWEIGTEGFKPVLQPVQEMTDQGTIKMKVVSNVREGRRIWVPPPVQPMPHHPFQSVNFLKRTLLAHLESRGAIHKSKGYRPAETEEERKEAERKALTMTRRREKIAAKTGGLQPPPVQPDYRVAEYAWKIGPRPIDPEAEHQPKATVEPTESVDEAFRRAEQFELVYHQNRLAEEEAIIERKKIRYEKYSRLRDQIRAEREEDIRLGRTEDVKREVERLQAIDRIYEYAQETGEDVSEWFAELGVDTRDGFGEREGRRLDGMMGSLLGTMKPSKSAKARETGSIEDRRYRRARQSVLARPRSESDSEFEFEDEDWPERDVRESGWEDKEHRKPYGLSFKARHHDEEIPSPRLFNRTQPKPWKQRFGFLNEGENEKRSSGSSSRKGFGLR